LGEGYGCSPSYPREASSMRGVGSERILRQITDALQQDEPGRGIGWELTIAGYDYTDLIRDDGEITVEGADGPALELTGEVAQKLSQDLESAEVSLAITVGGVQVEKFNGALLLPEHTEFGTELGAATGGFYAEGFELGSLMQFSGQAPDTVMYRVLTLLPYNLADINIAPISGPLFTRTEGSRFSFVQKVSEVTSQVIPEAGISWFDTASNGTKVFRESVLAEGVNSVWTFEVGREIKPADFRVTRNTDRYRQVTVSRPNEAATLTDDPNTLLARIDVPGSRAPLGSTFNIELSPGANASDAISRGYLEADKLSRRYTLDFITQYPHPLLERGDIISVVEPGQDALGKYVKYWLCVLVTDGVTLPGKRGHYGGPAVLIGTERVVLPEVFRLRGGVREIAFLAPYGWGTSWINTGTFWVRSEDEGFIGVDTTGLWIDETLAAPHGGGIDGGGLFLDG
jgi:hypothetical protein